MSLRSCADFDEVAACTLFLRAWPYITDNAFQLAFKRAHLSELQESGLFILSLLLVQYQEYFALFPLQCDWCEFQA